MIVLQSQRAVTTARTDYERVHERLMSEVPQLLEGRIEYFDVCVMAVMNAQVIFYLFFFFFCAHFLYVYAVLQSLYYKECSSSIQSGLESLQDYEDVHSCEESIQQTTAADLAAIRMLSIVGSQALVNT